MMRSRRALTLMEVLIVLAILGAMLALTMPFVLDRLAENAFSSAIDQVRGQVALTRAQAMARGESLEIRYLPASGRVEVRPFAAGNRAIGEREFGVRERGRSGLELDVAPDDSLDPVYLGSWARVALPGGVRITQEPPSPPLADEFAFNDGLPPVIDGRAPGSGTGMSPGAAHDDDAEALRLAVFLPDGSVLLARPLWLVDEEGRAARIELNIWTGRLTLAREDAASNPDGFASTGFDETEDDPFVLGADDEESDSMTSPAGGGR